MPEVLWTSGTMIWRIALAEQLRRYKIPDPYAPPAKQAGRKEHFGGTHQSRIALMVKEDSACGYGVFGSAGNGMQLA